MLLIKQNIDAFITMKNMNLLLFLKIDYHDVREGSNKEGGAMLYIDHTHFMFVKSYYSNWSTGRLLCCF